ncbi:MAG: biopolymer transporter ExbD [Verrucomicrobia bacterium]|nr:biopolymer transporter ExbD [Verrucomicrobiota bacterium]
MKFYPRRRKAAPAIIIISLIDVLIVMLVFLLFTTTFKNAPTVKLELPETSDPPKTGARNDTPPMIVTVAAREPNYFIGNRAVTADRLLNELRTAKTNDPQMRLVIRGDGDAAWRLVVKVLDFAKQSQITNVRAFTKSKVP